MNLRKYGPEWVGFLPPVNIKGHMRTWTVGWQWTLMMVAINFRKRLSEWGFTSYEHQMSHYDKDPALLIMVAIKFSLSGIQCYKHYSQTLADLNKHTTPVLLKLHRVLVKQYIEIKTLATACKSRHKGQDMDYSPLPACPTYWNAVPTSSDWKIQKSA